MVEVRFVLLLLPFVIDGELELRGHGLYSEGEVT